MEQLQANKNGTTIQPHVGANGRLYFNFCLGARFLCEETAAMGSGNANTRFVLKIERCQYMNGREYYYISRDGRAIYAPLTVSRLYYLLNFSLVDELAHGTRRELPLTAEEVRIYFAARKAHREAAEKRARQLLNSLPKYRELNARQAQLCIGIAYAEIHGADSAALVDEQHKVTDGINRLCATHNIDPQLLKGHRRCELCGDTGLTAAGLPCSCALRIEETIKDYCASMRINECKAV